MVGGSHLARGPQVEYHCHMVCLQYNIDNGLIMQKCWKGPTETVGASKVFVSTLSTFSSVILGYNDHILLGYIHLTGF